MCAPKVSKGRSQTFVCFHCPLVAAAAAIPPATIKVNSGSGDRRFPKGDRRRSSVFIALWSPPQRRNPLLTEKNRLRLKDQLIGRAHLARHSINVEKSSLGARLRTRKVTGRDASLPAPFVGHVWHTGRPRGSWGVAPNPTRGAASGLRKGHCPLTLSAAPRLERVILAFGAKRLFALNRHFPSAEPSARSFPAGRMPA